MPSVYLCSCGCGELCRITPSRERREKERAVRLSQSPRFFFTQEHRTKFRRQQNIPPEDATARLVCLAVIQNFGSDHYAAAKVCRLHPNHLRAIMTGRRSSHLSRETRDGLVKLGVDAAVLRAANGLTKEQYIARRITGRWVSRKTRRKISQAKTGKSIDVSRRRTYQMTTAQVAALQKGHALEPTKQLKRAWRIQSRRWHHASEDAKSGFITRWSGRLGVSPALLTRELDVALGNRKRHRGEKRPGLDAYIRIQELRRQGKSWQLIYVAACTERFTSSDSMKKWWKKFRRKNGAPVIERVRHRQRHRSRRWTDKETSYLRSHYRQLQQKQIARVLDRTRSAIVMRARKLGLRKRPVPQV